jgi:hypothetical protein
MTWRGARAAAAGLVGTISPVVSQSNRRRARVGGRGRRVRVADFRGEEFAEAVGGA